MFAVFRSVDRSPGRFVLKRQIIFLQYKNSADAIQMAPAPCLRVLLQGQKR